MRKLDNPEGLYLWQLSRLKRILTSNFIFAPNGSPSRCLQAITATSKVSAQFKNVKRCTVKYGKWHGADCWTKAQRRIFANDSENLLVVNDATNQAKSDQAPHEWLPPQENYWCEYGKRWKRIKDKYGLRYSS